jgi:hypothetical protein
MTQRWIWCGLLCAIAAPAAAQKRAAPAPSATEAALGQCRQMADAGTRLACFDKAVGELLAGTGNGSITIVDRGQLREARRSLFGFNLPRLPLFRGDRSADEQPEEITAAIQSAQSIGDGKFRITLADSGAVWETTEGRWNAEAPTAGQPVVIKRGLFGSYMLRIGGERAVRGRRVS